MGKELYERPSDAVLAHYGVKGMKWGVRRADRKARKLAPTEVQTKVVPGARVQTSGGRNQKPSEDAIRVATNRQKARASTPDALSTKELQEMVTRMNLEQQYSKLTSKQKNPGRKLVSKVMTDKKLRAQVITGASAAGAFALAVATIGKDIERVNLKNL